MRIPLARMIRQSRIRRKVITLRPITLPGMLATDLFAIYRPVLEAWSAALPRLTEQYERTLAQMTTDAPDDLGATIDEVESDLNAVFMAIRLRLERWAAHVEAAHRRKWAATVLAGANIDLTTMLGPADVRQTVAAVIEANVSLVRSVSDEARRKISDSVFRGFQRRASAADIAREMREAVAMQRRRALRIAGDQVSKLGSQLNDERRRQAGIDQWEWIHSGKVHARPEHVARNGKVYSEDDLRDDRPGMAPFCGCTSRAVLNIDAMIERELEAA